MQTRRPVTLQINVAPTDLPHAAEILPHQLRQWSAQVDEILFTLDVPRGGKGRFNEGADERRPKFDGLLAGLCAQYEGAEVREVDYSPTAKSAVGEAFFGGAEVPEKDSRGGPFYSYVFGLHAAAHDLIVHLDSDMMFGGGSRHWTVEAARQLEEHPDLLACCPLPGPPTESGELTTQQGRRVLASWPAFRFDQMTTRAFLLDRRRLREMLAPLSVSPPPRLRSRVKARMLGNPPFALVEDLLTRAMVEGGMQRLDFLGQEPGMWSLHPPFRSPDFYAGLTELIRRIETGDIPDEQRGDYDVNSSLVDWGRAEADFKRRRWFS